MSFELIFTIVGSVVVALVASPFLVAGIRILRADPTEYRNNKERSKSIDAALRGDLPTEHAGIHDELVSAGLSVEVIKDPVTGSTKRVWKRKGRLSAEAVNAIR